MKALIILLGAAAAAVAGPHDADVASLRASLDAAAKRYEAGDRAGAADEAAAGFMAFEECAFHNAVAARDHGVYKSLEVSWLDLVKAYESGDPRPAQRALDADLRRAERLFAEPASAGKTAFDAFFILFREGFEALLILGAIAATLRKLGRPEMNRLLWSGAVAAVAASFGLYALSVSVLRISGAGQEILEGVTMLVAAAVLFWMSYWLISRIEGRRWQQFIQENVKKALSRGNGWALASLAFLVVFREGFETVLMIRALEAGGAGWTPILGGMGAASLALVGVFVAVMIAGVRLPIRTFFSVTSAVLLALVFKFTGDGILELQEGGVLGRNPVAWLPSSGFLPTWLGFHASVEGLLAQGLVLLAIAAGLAWTFRRQKPAAPEASASPARAPEPAEVAR
jgi:high-affinity iron transporter